MSDRHPVVGIHDFLNSRPLLHPIRHGLVETPFTLVTDTPARLAERFAAGELDIAMLPSIEYARNPEAVIVPGSCIASLGKVETVLLFSDLALEDIETICVDPKSRTSVAMLSILFRERLGREPIIVTGEEDPARMLRAADAGLVIGDRAFDLPSKRHLIHDLGELWYEYAGRPFVHALLCARKGGRWDAAVAALAEAKRVGLAHRELIAKEAAGPHLPEERALNYLMSHILYDLAGEEIAGLSHFLDRAVHFGLAPSSELRWYGE